MRPGQIERRTHDYKRHGVTDLFAALNLATGQVVHQTRPQHRAIEFRKFLDAIDESVPADLAVHVVLDNSSTHKTPAIHDWLLHHPRFTFHFTPTSSSWMNLVERWFAELTNKMLARSAHKSITALTADLNAWIAAWNDNPKTVRLAQDRRPDPRQPQEILDEPLTQDTSSGSWSRSASVIGSRRARSPRSCGRMGSTRHRGERRRHGGSSCVSKPGMVACDLSPWTRSASAACTSCSSFITTRAGCGSPASPSTRAGRG